MPVKLVSAAVAVALLLGYVLPLAFKLKEGALAVIIGLGVVMMLVDLGQSDGHRRRHRRRPGLPEQADPDGGHLPHRRRARHPGAHCLPTRPSWASRWWWTTSPAPAATSAPTTWPRPPRRPHAGDGHGGHALDQRRAVQQDALRHGEGLHPGGACGLGAQPAGGQQRPAGEDGGRADRLHEGQPQQAELRLAGHRHLGARVGRAVQVA
jgi:hypothetical protein